MADGSLSDNAEQFVSAIDRKITGKYVFTLHEVLTDPNALTEKPTTKATIDGLRKDVDQYFDSLLADYQDEQRDFASQLEASTSLTNKIREAIKSKLGGKVPLIAPVTVDLATEKEDTIVISEYTPDIESLLLKLASVSNFVADTSTKYNDYTLGSWLFSGSRNYTLAVNPPTSVILSINSARDEIDAGLDALAAGM